MYETTHRQRYEMIFEYTHFDTRTYTHIHTQRTSIVTFRKEAYNKRWETTQTCMIKLMNDCQRTRNSLFCVPECRGNTCNAKDWWDGTRSFSLSCFRSLYTYVYICVYICIHKYICMYIHVCIVCTSKGTTCATNTW